jgi:chromosome segregation ATPase
VDLSEILTHAVALVGGAAGAWALISKLKPEREKLEAETERYRVQAAREQDDRIASLQGRLEEAEASREDTEETARRLEVTVETLGRRLRDLTIDHERAMTEVQHLRATLRAGKESAT